LKFLVIGAGLGGLTAAIALRQQGFDVDVCEAADRIAEVGAGLTLGRGAQHVFRALGIQSQVAAIACPAGALPFVHYRTGKLLFGAFDTGDGLPDDGETDIVRHCYRADLQAVLLAELAALGVVVRSGMRLTELQQADHDVTARFANSDTVQADILIAADGVRSAARALLWPGDEPRFTDHVAYRFLVPAEQAAPFMALGRSAIFIGPQRTFNRYTMAGGRVVNCAGLVETAEAVPEGWSIAASKEEIAQAFAGWHPDVLALIGCATSSIKWGLYDRAPLKQWSVGRVVLIGDAAHAMLPFLGMGAAMAIEDGYVLARAFAQRNEPAAALARFQAARAPRTELVHAKSVEQGRITQAMDPDAIDPASIPMADQAMMAFNPVTAAL
jgi:salicylate hydroxylase